MGRTLGRYQQTPAITVSPSAVFRHDAYMRDSRGSDGDESLAASRRRIRGRQRATRPNVLLAFLGVVLLVVAVVGFLMNKTDALVGAFLVIGAALVLVAVLMPRLEGPIEVSLTGAKLNIATLAAVAEAELAAGSLTELEDLL